jgi:hypothetical protein
VQEVGKLGVHLVDCHPSMFQITEDGPVVLLISASQESEGNAVRIKVEKSEASNLPAANRTGRSA